MNSDRDSHSPMKSASLVRELPLIGLLILLVTGSYLARIDTPPLRGEETRRAMVAINMIETGDWVVPRQQGDPYFMSSRPPLQSWAMAGTAYLRGRFDAVAIRLPSVLALLALTVLIYVYARNFVGQVGAFLAAACFSTFGQVLELGRTGETDLLFTLFVASSLFSWHIGFVRRWPALIAWTLPYVACALATMTKGPQAPVYFAGSVGIFLLLTRNFRYVFSWGHATGIGCYACIVGAWLVPYYQALGLDGVRHVFTGDVALYTDFHFAPYLEHLARYPIEIVCGCLLPWSPLLMAYLYRDVRKSLGAHSRHILFWCVCLAVTFPTVWVFPGAQTRFFLSMYPCIAMLMAVGLNACREREPTAHLWSRFFTGMMCVSVLVAAITGIGWLVGLHDFRESQTPLFITAFVALMLGVAGVLFWTRNRTSPFHAVTAVTAVAVFAGALYAGFVVNELTAASSRVDLAFDELDAMLPEDHQLVSIGPVEHGFAYQYYVRYGKLIPMLDEETPELNDTTWVCAGEGAEFPCEPIATVYCGRLKDAPTHPVYVGHHAECYVERQCPAQTPRMAVVPQTPLR